MAMTLALRSAVVGALALVASPQGAAAFSAAMQEVVTSIDKAAGSRGVRGTVLERSMSPPATADDAFAETAQSLRDLAESQRASRDKVLLKVAELAGEKREADEARARVISQEAAFNASQAGAERSEADLEAVAEAAARKAVEEVTTANSQQSVADTAAEIVRQITATETTRAEDKVDKAAVEAVTAISNSTARLVDATANASGALATARAEQEAAFAVAQQARLQRLQANVARSTAEAAKKRSDDLQKAARESAAAAETAKETAERDARRATEASEALDYFDDEAAKAREAALQSSKDASTALEGVTERVVEGIQAKLADSAEAVRRAQQALDATTASTLEDQ
eukprot:TRINITY_DN39073_c0_g1_i1.p1 TRINITY_DN39073_c0_g1~~TRINITY_DN39073_c0_g1_i1.p1  ORF type:complete len:344 (+),score=125.41 TRINITY_DN39073_c0_g1_i1:135-1166(+)